jgi:hypothetical protein
MVAQKALTRTFSFTLRLWQRNQLDLHFTNVPHEKGEFAHFIADIFFHLPSLVSGYEYLQYTSLRLQSREYHNSCGQ